ncbi:MAG: small ribosomal subunit Rsm22 family protein [Haloarculaceae archaeon]
MNDDQRRQVRENAQYLQSVRPIDPEEIYEYVEGQPHPATVRQVLRESAVDLGLLERPDGTFVPVEDGPVAVEFDGVERLPETYARRLEDLLVERYGPGWPEDESGDRLRERVREIKERYLRGNPVDYDETTALGYALYHLPAYYAAVQYVLADLLVDGLLPRDLRVLDVGAGVGGPALGLHDLLYGAPGASDERGNDDADAEPTALVDYHAVEPSAAADVLTDLLSETGSNFHPSIHRTTAEAFDPDGEYDLLVFANVLSELDDPEAVLERYLDALAPEGTLVALAPADRNTAIQLRDIERAVADHGPATVYAPTVRLWPHDSPDGECWSFDVQPDLDVPAFQRRLDDAATDQDHEDGEFENVDVQYAYSLLRLDGRQSIDVSPDRSRVAKMAESESFVTERVDLLAVKLSHDLADDGNPLFLVGDGSQQVDHFAVLTEESMLNADLRTADYGDLLSIENALVLWNDDERAYNVVIDGETVVDSVPADRL